ncbi:hypothetical protein MAPG_02390 [Magnaporthiopsis poae ATCC 64411]|uniref:Uncharacterized protein n=1 Tax=Magnaporthiopsis poae (strain ATCC 64411 / 73-15) TaxID=644358 RepID=A0A0C4DR84_MAGP6|nr:hypothetical protein MAPG_02390 [Magnaporthiopsis poae ATCC 64411]
MTPKISENHVKRCPEHRPQENKTRLMQPDSRRVASRHTRRAPMLPLGGVSCKVITHQGQGKDPLNGSGYQLVVARTMSLLVTLANLELWTQTGGFDEEEIKRKINKKGWVLFACVSMSRCSIGTKISPDPECDKSRNRKEKAGF